MKKRLLSVLITVALIYTILPLPAAAAGAATVEPATATEQGLQDAINTASDGDTIKLNADININTITMLVTKSITLDLNGHTLSTSISGTSNADLKTLLYYTATGTFTITDSSALGNGRITSSVNYSLLINNAGSGTVVCEKGSLSTTDEWGVGVINASNGRLSITGGTISSDLSFAVYNGASTGTVDITGGTISTSSGFAVINNGIVNMSGGTLSGNTGICFHNQPGGTFTLTGGSVTSNSSYGVNNNGHFIMTGGTIFTQSSDALSNSVVGSISDVSGGTIHSNTSTTLVNYAGTMNVSGGVITSGGDCAVFNNGVGTVNITGGEISASRVTFYNNSTGTISINQGTYASVYNKTGVVKINGGSIKTVSTAAPVNDAGTGLVLYTFVLKDTSGNVIANTNLSSATLQFTPAATPDYNMSGVKTDAAGKIYVWLPNDKTAVSFTYNGITTSGDIVNYSKEIVIPNFSATVTLKKDDAIWTDTATYVCLSESATNIYTMNGTIDGTLNNGVYTFKGLDSSKTYYVWLITYGFQCSYQTISKDATSATLDLYTISLSAGEGIASTLGSGFTILKGDSITIRATAATDYTFSKWVQTSGGTTVSTDANYKIENISAPWKLTATATLNIYPATVTVKKDDTVWTSGAPVMMLSESSTVQTALLTGTESSGVYTFADLNPTKTYYVWDTTANKYTGQIVNKNTTSAAVDYYTVTLTNGTGVSVATGGDTYMKGSSVPINATVSANYAWNNWVQTAGGTTFSTTQAYTITNISAPYALTATATSTVYDATVTVKKDDTTWTSGTPSMQLSESNSNAALNAITVTSLNGVYTFTGLSHTKIYYVWDMTNNQYTGQTISKNMTAAVVDYYTVSIIAGTGIATISGEGTYMKGNSVPINATPAGGYLWSKWIQTTGGATLSTVQAYTITGINKPYALTAMGALDLYTATVTVNQNDSAWTAGGTPIMVLSDSSSAISNQVAGTLLNGVYTFTGLVRATTYYVWDTTNSKFTGQLISKNTTSVVVDYYTVTLTSGIDFLSTTGSGAYMKGTNISLSAVVASGYSWSKWVQTVGGTTVSDTQGYAITNISTKYTLTAKSTTNYSGGALNINSGSIVISDSAHNGYITITQGSTIYDDIDPATNITIEGGISTAKTITVSASLGAVITLKDVNISVNGAAPFDITSTAGAVTVDLNGINILTANTLGFAGLQKANGGRLEAGMLTIQSSSGTGSLAAAGRGSSNDFGAGIGGYVNNSAFPKYGDGSYITITGGTITATGGYRAAGIAGNHITINGDMLPPPGMSKLRESVVVSGAQPVISPLPAEQ